MANNLKVTPLHDRVIVKPAKAEEKTAGGIIIPDTAKEKPQRGTVMAAGPGKKDEPVTVKIGDTVLYGKYSGTEIQIEGEDLRHQRGADIGTQDDRQHCDVGHQLAAGHGGGHQDGGGAALQGQRDARQLAKLADGRLKATSAQIEDALQGRIRDHHRFMLRLHLRQIDALDGSVAMLDARVEELLLPFAEVVRRLKTIPGVRDVVASVLLAEIGTDMSQFRTAGHLVSWACLSPRLDESAGKRRSTRTRKGQWLKAVLVQAAWAAVRQKDTYLHAQFHRIRSRRGAKKAIVAVAASILTAAYHMIRNEADYNDLGSDFFAHRDRSRQAYRLVERLQKMGYVVNLEAAA